MGAYRLITRSDFDGLVCGMLLRERGLVEEVMFVHPKDMQDGLVPVTGRDIITNLPYVPGCYLCFDHHGSELARLGAARRPRNHVIDPTAPSAARVVFDHFGGPAAFPAIDPALMDAVDQADSAQYTRADILAPSGWALLGFIMDARTGLGRFRDFRISNYELMMQLIDECRRLPIEAVLRTPDVAERVRLFEAQQEPFAAQLRRCTTMHGKLAVIDLRNEETIHAGNRFAVYALFPSCTVSAHLIPGLRGADGRAQRTVFALGRSILDRSSGADLGAFCLRHGGGGHAAAGTCQVPNDRAATTLAALVAEFGRPRARRSPPALAA